MKATLLASLLALAGAMFSPAVSAETNRPNFDLVRQLNEAFVQVAETASPSVVVLKMTEKSTIFAEPTAEDGPEQHDYWRRFHRQFNDEPTEGRGSGIIIRKNGFIMTNRHVVENAEKIEVRLLDGRNFIAQVHAVDALSDVAVIKIEAEDLPVAKLGDSSKVRVGEFAIAIGAPFDLDYTVTFGHISAKSRANVVPFIFGGQNMDQDFLQTDANINPGNSGGPLVNIEGEVIGVNTLIRGLRSGIGFAIPINLAHAIAEQLISNGRFIRPWLGIEIAALSDQPEIQKTAPLLLNGVVVRAIMPKGPASESDLRASDIIVAVDGRSVGAPQQLRGEIRGKTVGKTVTLDVFRAGEARKLEVKLGEMLFPVATPTEEEPSVDP
jgi:serine protease Do